MIRILFIFLIAISLTSCATRHHVTTDAIVDKNKIPLGFPVGSRFAIGSLNQESQLFTKEIAQKIGKLLESAGYQITDELHADYILIFNYGMLEKSKTISVPHYIPGPTKVTQGNVFAGGNAAVYQETTQESGTTVFIPENVTFFTRDLTVTVYLGANREEQLWQGFATNMGRDDDLRDAMDYLLVSTFKYFGHSTKKKVDTVVCEKDDAILWLRA